MSRNINADLQYSAWFDDWDWSHKAGRSVTRWGSANNYDGENIHQSSDLRITYDPGANVFSITNHYLMRRFRAEMGFRAIVLRALWYFRYGGSTGSGGPFDVRTHKYLRPSGYPDVDDNSFAYKDITGTIPWGLGGYDSQYGIDISSDAIATSSFDQTGLANGDFFPAIDLTDYFAQQLLENDDLWFEVFQVTSSTTMWVGSSNLPERPKLVVDYLFPVEMYPEDPARPGEIDLSRLLNTDNEPITLGAYQKGQTGSSQLFFTKNFSRETLAHLEVWDDHPEWNPPAADAGNGGTADLAYIEVFENCVSQRWEVKFLTATTFEVKADSYLDNLESLHPQYDAAPAWQGAVGSDWDSPDGSIRIPSAAWSGTAVADDLIVTYTRGQQTDSSWPADSNDQVQIANDVAGSPGDWRPINGRRTTLAVADSVDAATITVTVERIVTGDWPVGEKVFLANPNTIDIGDIKSVTATTIEIENLSITNNNYGIGDIVATTLPVRSLTAAPWAQLTAASGVSESNKRRLYILDADVYGFGPGEDIYVQSNDVPATSELLVISTITSTYIEATTDMVNDYEIGAVVVEKASGEEKFHLRVVADPATTEELKEFRLNIIA